MIGPRPYPEHDQTPVLRLTNMMRGRAILWQGVNSMQPVGQLLNLRSDRQKVPS